MVGDLEKVADDISSPIAAVKKDNKLFEMYLLESHKNNNVHQQVNTKNEHYKQVTIFHLIYNQLNKSFSFSFP